VTVLAGRYALVDRIGEGATGEVWLAHDQKLERDVAVKVLRPLVASEPEQRRRFGREARVLAQLSHEHIVRLFDYVDDGTQALLVMEYVDALNLAEATARSLPLPVGDAAAYLAPVARALAYAHAKDVVHRDLTPSNVLIERRDRRVVVTDFGLARLARSTSTLTAAGTLIGTPEYWSPEQARGRPTDGATDMYALGCIFFLLLSGRLPFEGEDRLAVGLRRAHEAAPSLGERRRAVMPEAVELADALLAHDPTDRPSARETASALAALADDAPTASPLRGRADESRSTVAFSVEQPTVVAERPVRRRSRRRTLVTAFALSAATTVGAFLLLDALTTPVLRAPKLVALRESAARARIHEALPGTTVQVARTYSLRVAAGRVIRQEPSAGRQLPHDSFMRLVVSSGTPFAAVPTIAAGMLPGSARAALTKHGFAVRYRFTPSWTIRKGTVIEVRPRSGTRLRRPARVRVLIASGYPRAVVPNVQEAEVGAAQAQLEARHLRYHVVYRIRHDVPAGRVLGQIPTAGATVYQGTRVRLTVARTMRWERIFAQSGLGAYESEPFSVPERWRIRYRLAPGGFGVGLARIVWWSDEEPHGGDTFLATAGDGVQTHAVSTGAGTFRLAVNPYGGGDWSVEVDALR
jgi:serine/threonine-protein kinase